ncbi:MAG: exonuclease domain-containing protein [Bacteroidales bacterium]
MLKISRPVVFFDLETTGANVKTDQIVEIAVVKIHPDGKKESRTRRVKPDIPISPGATQVHGITDEDVANEPSFRQLAKSLYIFFDQCDLGGFNVDRFDLPLLVNEFRRAEMQIPFDLNTKVVDPMKIFHRREPRDLSAAYSFYCNKTLEDAHSADADINATVEVLYKQIEKYGLENDIDSLICAGLDSEQKYLDRSGFFTADEEGNACFRFGKYAGKNVVLTDPSHLNYLDWMLKQDFPFDTHEIIKKLLKGQIG